MKKQLLMLIVFNITLFFISNGNAQNLANLPLFKISDLQYQGAFRIPAKTFGASDVNWAQGIIEYNPDNHSIFIVGHAHHQAIAEFPIPTLVNSSTVGDLNMAANPIQDFSLVLNATTNGNPEGLDRIGGMEYLSNSGNPKLIVNAYEYYDAPASNTLSTLVINDANDIAGSSKDGYYSYNTTAGHICGWISPIPEEWQDTLGSNYIAGQSSGQPIIGRWSVGPTAFVFNPEDFLAAPTSPVSVTKLLGFSLSNKLHDDLSNTTGSNDLWTHLTNARFGFIVPGTRTYLTLGYSGGHTSGVCYKCTQNNGNLCGGYCAPDADDYYQYFWSWDMLDLLDVMNGVKQAHEIRPYDYGEFNTPFETQIAGGTFDPNTGLLYLTISKADREQGTYSNPPIIVAYKIGSTTSSGTTNSWMGDVSIYPNPASENLTIQYPAGFKKYQLQVINALGQVVYNEALSGSVSYKGNLTKQLDISTFRKGIYMINIQTEFGNTIKRIAIQ